MTLDVISKSLSRNGFTFELKIMRTLLLSILTFCCIYLKAQLTFSIQTTPTQVALQGISFADSLIGYACGDAGTVIQTTDGGNNWQTLTTNISDDLWDIKVIPGSLGMKVIAVGENNRVIKSVDGGLNWTLQNIPFQAGSFVFGIQCIDSLNYYACGGDFGTFSGAILKTNNGGINWTKIIVGSSMFLDKIFMLSPTKGFVAGSGNTFTNGGIGKTLNGSSWVSSNTSNSLVTNVWCPTKSNVIAIGLGGQIWRSQNTGTSWTNLAVNNVDLYGICFSDSLNGIICGGSSAGSIILITTDGGVNWVTNTTHTLNAQLTSVCESQGKIYIAGGNGTVLKAWQPYVPPPPPIYTETQFNSRDADFDIFYSSNLKSINIQYKDCNTLNDNELIIFDNLGRPIASYKNVCEWREIKTSSFENGVYYFQFIINKTILKSGKLIVY